MYPHPNSHLDQINAERDRAVEQRMSGPRDPVRHRDRRRVRRPRR